MRVALSGDENGISFWRGEKKLVAGVKTYKNYPSMLVV